MFNFPCSFLGGLLGLPKAWWKSIQRVIFTQSPDDICQLKRFCDCDAARLSTQSRPLQHAQVWLRPACQTPEPWSFSKTIAWVGLLTTWLPLWKRINRNSTSIISFFWGMFHWNEIVSNIVCPVFNDFMIWTNTGHPFLTYVIPLRLIDGIWPMMTYGGIHWWPALASAGRNNKSALWGMGIKNDRPSCEQNQFHTD